MTNEPTLVIADDELLMRQLLLQTLGSQGFKVLLAEDGEQALRLVKSHPVNLVLTDINMPNVSGLKLVEQLQESDYKDLPVILMTADSDHFTNPELKGATILRKPFRRRELVELINSVLGRAIT